MLDRHIPLVAALLAILVVPPVDGQQIIGLDDDETLVLREIGVVATVEDSGALTVLTVLPDEVRPAAHRDVELQRGDELLMMNGTRLKDLETARTLYDDAAVAAPLKLAVRRGDERFLASFVKMDPADLEASEGDGVMVRRMAIGGDDFDEMQPLMGLGIVAGTREGEVHVAAVLPIGESPFEQGDVVRTVDGQAITELAALQALVEAAAAGTSFEVTVGRGDDDATFDAVKQATDGRVMIRRNP